MLAAQTRLCKPSQLTSKEAVQRAQATSAKHGSTQRGVEEALQQALENVVPSQQVLRASEVEARAAKQGSDGRVECQLLLSEAALKHCTL